MVKKILLGIVIVIIIAIIAIYFSLNFWVKHGIERVGTMVTGTQVSVQSVELSPFAGSLVINGLTVADPKPFKNRYLANVKQISMKVDLNSIFSDEVVVHHVIVDKPHVYYHTGFGGSNLGQLQANIAKKQGNENKGSKEASASKSGKKVVIDLLKINHTAVTGKAFGASVNLDIPTITLKNLGKDNNGMSAAQLTGLVVTMIVSNMAKLGVDVASGAVKMVGNVAKGAGQTAVSTVSTVGKGVGGAVKGVGSAVGGLFGGKSKEDAASSK